MIGRDEATEQPKWSDFLPTTRPSARGVGFVIAESFYGGVAFWRGTLSNLSSGRGPPRSVPKALSFSKTQTSSCRVESKGSLISDVRYILMNFDIWSDSMQIASFPANKGSKLG